MMRAGGTDIEPGLDDAVGPLQVPQPDADGLWLIRLDGLDIDRLRVEGSVLCLADGSIGTSGAPIAFHPGLYRSVVAAGVYVGEGPATHLLTGPIAMQLPYELVMPPSGGRVLDLRCGALFEEVLTSEGALLAVRFSSLARPGTAVFRASCPSAAGPGDVLLPPEDDPPHDQGSEGDVMWMRARGDPGGIAAAAMDQTHPSGSGLVIDRVAAYEASPGELPRISGVVERCRLASATGFGELYAEHSRAWAERWDASDIVVDGDDELQRSIRFSLFHLIASVSDGDEAAVGARGLSGTGYGGHVFWDADTFTLPFLAATHPRSARAMLEYRIRRLPAARRAAEDIGRSGARFPWESAYSGRDVTPTSARDRTGKTVPIRTGLLEEHIVSEVAWATSCYIDWSGDTEFARGPGLELLADTARYWASRVRDEPGGAHIYGVIGPDEYHEPVDDNAFTNVMARWNLRRGAGALLACDTSPAAMEEAAEWRAIADRITDGYDPGSGIYEQFAGFHALEPLIISEIAPRRPIAADLLLGAERVSGAQVVKQADVLMLHHLVPDEVAAGSLQKNLAFYEPRTAHGSSLSPGIHASLFARAREYDRAVNALRMACRMDLDDLTATTGGGLHLATMGTVWQALVFGFAGLRARSDGLVVDPRLPPSWPSLGVRVRYHGHSVLLQVEQDRITVDAGGPVAVRVDGIEYEAGRRPLSIERRRRTSEEVP